MKPSYDAVIFDFGGVIINIDYQATIDAFTALGISDFDALYSQAQQSDLFDAIETGKISQQHFINGLLQLLPKNVTPNQVVHAWNAMILDIPAHRIAFLKELRQYCPIYLLSNTNAIHIDKAFREWNRKSTESIHEIFNKVYLSHEMKMRKPNREIFEAVCTENVLNPSQVLFIDDSLQHIEGARAFGLKTHHLKVGEEIQTLFS